MMRLPYCRCAGSDQGASGLGPGFGGAPEPDNATQQRGVGRFAAGRSLRLWDVPGGCQPGQENREAGGEQTQGALRTDAGHIRVRHQHDGGQGPETVRVSDLQETSEDGSQVRGIDRFRDGQQPETLDTEGRGSVVRHKINA